MRCTAWSANGRAIRSRSDGKLRSGTLARSRNGPCPRRQCCSKPDIQRREGAKHAVPGRLPGGVASALNGHAEKLVQSRAPTKHNKHHYNNNHDGGQCEPPKSRPVQPTVGCSVSPATRWNIAGIIHPSFFKDFFDAEGASRAPVFELHAENIYVQPHLGPSRLAHQVLMGLGASLLEETRQFLPSISPISRHHKLAPPTEVVCARAPFRFVRA